MLDKPLFLVALAGTAVVWADVLVREGMLLAPVQRWLREWYSKPYRPVAYTTDPDQPNLGPIRCLGPVTTKEIDEQWWWKPLWGCSTCVAGQWGFWGYLLRYHAGYTHGWATALFDTLPEHIAFTAFTIIAAIIISKWTRDN